MVDWGCGYGAYHPVAPRPLSYRSFVHRLFSSASHLQRRHERPLLVKNGIMGEKWPVTLACDTDSHVNHRVLLHAANLRHGTDGFTSPPKEDLLWIFLPEKSDGFGRVRTRVLTTRPPKPLLHGVSN
jgi:hypothetical protein